MLSVCLVILESPKEKKKFEEIYIQEVEGLLKYAKSRIEGVSIFVAEDAVVRNKMIIWHGK
ncbi:MAG: hypothetical protein HFI40_13350 [Lachnospiraceae bacterium]|jgi:hypothetical protein|nr:hypothetical protein [Lachnospiraceae bacterium]